MDAFRDFIKKVLDKILDRVGIFSILPALFIFGIASLFFNLSISISLFIITLASAGFLELFHTHRKSDINQRRQVIYDRNSLIFAFMMDKKKIHYPKVFEEFLYENMGFKLVGIQDIPLPMTVTGPLCPRCQNHLLEDVSIKFPGRAKIIFKCICGYSHVSKKTQEEIIYELSQLKSLPVDDK